MKYTFFSEFEFGERCPFSNYIISYAQKQALTTDLSFDDCHMSTDEKTYTTRFTFRNSLSEPCKEITVTLTVNDDKSLSFDNSIKTLPS